MPEGLGLEVIEACDEVSEDLQTDLLDRPRTQPRAKTVQLIGELPNGRWTISFGLSCPHINRNRFHHQQLA